MQPPLVVAVTPRGSGYFIIYYSTYILLDLWNKIVMQSKCMSQFPSITLLSEAVNMNIAIRM